MLRPECSRLRSEARAGSAVALFGFWRADLFPGSWPDKGLPVQGRAGQAGQHRAGGEDRRRDGRSRQEVRNVNVGRLIYLIILIKLLVRVLCWCALRDGTTFSFCLRRRFHPRLPCLD